MATNQAIAFADPSPALEPKYLFWFLRSQRPYLRTAGKGATQKNISQTVLKAWPVPLPPLNEQRRIVAAIEEHLSRLDAADASLATAFRRVSVARRALLSAAVAEGDEQAVGDPSPESRPGSPSGATVGRRMTGSGA